MGPTKKLAAAVLTAAVMSAGAPVAAHAATAGPSVRVATAEAAFTAAVAAVNMTGPATLAETAGRNPCKKVKNWKMRMACEAVKRAGGMWALQKLEDAARKGWNDFSRTFESLPG
nr:hypothetical protein GCM10020093_097000 [Planobispora longispora]